MRKPVNALCCQFALRREEFPHVLLPPSESRRRPCSKIFRIGLQNLSGDGRLVVETRGSVKCLAKAWQGASLSSEISGFSYGSSRRHSGLDVPALLQQLVDEVIE